LESRLIKQYAPRYNILMRDDKRYLLAKIDLNEKFPRLQLARVRKDDNCRYFGPFPKGTALRMTVDFLTTYFGLRSCRTSEPGEEDRKHCQKRIVKDCSEPCSGKVTEQGYRVLVDKMLELLNGHSKPLVEELNSKMKLAANEMNFEKAARIRDVIFNIEEVFSHKNRSFRYATIPSAGGSDSVAELKKVLGLENNPTVIQGFDISNILGTLAVGSMVCFENGRPERSKYRRFRIKDVHQSDDFAMMAEVFQRHFGRQIKDGLPLPDLIMVDGGKGQLSAAIASLIELGCPPLPIIGLAKKNEEIFIPGRKDSIILDRHSSALRLLQAIRDEAHRFAVSYHRELRSRRLQESLLDDIPGIGKKRKQLLLEAFGSVRELRKASVDDIVNKVSGVGKKFAEKIVDFFGRKD
ncbi:MAG: excinuclease ABC subunit UvrC, partial [Victivallaceae bacterium]